jgi:hypothetical protein
MSVDGTWDITIKTLIGERKATVILKSEDGATLRTKERLLYDGMVEGDTVRWKTDVTSPMALTLAFTGKVSGDSIAGSVATRIGTWSFRGVRA